MAQTVVKSLRPLCRGNALNAGEVKRDADFRGGVIIQLLSEVVSSCLSPIVGAHIRFAVMPLETNN
jgi:hypothetical protein